MNDTGTTRHDAQAIVTAHWPAGKVDHRRFHTAAQVAAKLVAYLRHHTVPGPDAYTVATAEDMARLLDQLGMLALELPRLLAQLASIAQQLDTTDTPHTGRDDHADHPVGPNTVDKLNQFLDQAHEDAMLLEMRLAQACACTDHLRLTH